MPSDACEAERPVLVAIVGDGPERAALGGAGTDARHRIARPVSGTSRRRAALAGRVRCLRELLDQRGRVADDSRGDGRGAAGRRDARRRHAGGRRRRLGPAGRRRATPSASGGGAAGARARSRRARGASGRAARRRLESRFTLDRMVREYGDVYASVSTDATGTGTDMCGICGVFALDGRSASEARARRCRAMNARDRASRSRRRRLLRRGVTSRSATAGWRSSIAPAAISRWPTKTGRAGSSSTARSTTIASCGRCSKRRATGSAPSSDTETILHAYEEYGPACVDRLEGMFAFAIYDGRRRELFAARDRLGKKPFFYTVLDGVFHFASELPALTRSPLWKGELDLTALEGYLSLGYFLAPATIYRDVYKLLPGHWLRVANGRIETARVLGRPRVRHRSAPGRRAAAGDRRDASAGRPRTARERSAARRVPERRHRLGPGRLVHGRGARRSAGHDVGRLRRARRTTSSRRPR